MNKSLYKLFFRLSSDVSQNLVGKFFLIVGNKVSNNLITVFFPICFGPGLEKRTLGRVYVTENTSVILSGINYLCFIENCNFHKSK